MNHDISFWERSALEGDPILIQFALIALEWGEEICLDSLDDIPLCVSVLSDGEASPL
jgi:hypothetical protein